MDSLLFNKNAPQILKLAANRAGEWSNHSWKWLYALRRTVLNRVATQERTTTRTIRSDQRQAISQIVQVLLLHLDLKTMQVGFTDGKSDTFIHLTIDFLSRKANLSQRRAQRAMRWLHQSGYITFFRQSTYDEATDTYLHKPSVRTIQDKLLLELGITLDALRKARNRAFKRFQKHVIDKITRFYRPKKKQNHSPEHSTSPSIDYRNHRLRAPPEERASLPTYHAKVAKLMNLFPGLTEEEARAMLPSP